MFNLCLSYNLSDFDCVTLDDNRQIIKMLKTLIDHFQKNLQIFPCLDLYYIFSFLYMLNKQDFDKRPEKYDEIQLISEFKKMEMIGQEREQSKFKKNEENNQSNGKNIIEKLKEGAFYKQNSNKENPWEIVQRIGNKITFNKDIVVRQIGVIQIEKKQSEQDELSFYINKFIELTEMSQSSQLSHSIIYLSIQISFILERQIVQENSQTLSQAALLRSKISDRNYLKFIQILRQSFNCTEQQQSFFKFSVQDAYFRFLSVYILLQFYLLKFKQDELFIHLLLCYLTEKDNQIKIVFQSNKQFCDDLKIKLETKEQDNLISQVIQYQQDRLKSFESNKININEIQNIFVEIKSEEDFNYTISLNLIEKWELEARKRIEADIADQNDILLEVQDLYIDQNIQFLDGKNIFEEKDKLENQNAINIIREFFLKQMEQNGNQECKILTILAEGGTGKSMLIKKLELELMKERSITQQDQQHQQKQSNNLQNNFNNDNKKVNFIPLMVKCSNLDAQNPSLEDYFKQQELDIKEIMLLQKMETHKLILLDGYDEFTGEYFKIYEKLKLQNWVNTLFIVFSRTEKIILNDAKIYFSTYDQFGIRIETSYCIFKLKQFQRNDILEYCNKFSYRHYFQQFQINDSDQQQDLINLNDEQISIYQKQLYDDMEQCLKCNQLENLLSKPINLYFFTRLIIGKSSPEIKEIIKNMSDEIQIYDIFIKDQFQLETINFINKNNLDIRNQQLRSEICTCYYIYFQNLAMQMFENKGKKSDFLQIFKQDIYFELSQVQFQSLNQKYFEPLARFIEKYVKNKIIARVKDAEIDIDGIIQKDQMLQILEFKHRSLFEYFAARAMKHDFDQHKEEIYKLNMSQLKQFNINKRIIMTTQKNTSEQQILLNLYKLLKAEIDSAFFKSNYSQQDISQTNRYIQYLKKSQIFQSNQRSQIDVGSSNLLSALFLSKFSFPSLQFSKCSFSQAYLPGYSRKCVNFQDCNLKNSILENQYLDRFETSNTKHSINSSILKKFGYEDVYQFQNAIFYEDTLVSITKTGYINQFQFISDDGDDSFSFKKLKSNKIANLVLKQIYLVRPEDIFVVLTDKYLFEIDCKSFQKVRQFQFSDRIISLLIKHSKYIITLANELIYYGNIKNGFKLLYQIQGTAYQFVNDTIITTQNNQICFYDILNQQLITQIDFNDYDLSISAISPDGMYLAAVTLDGLRCAIYNLENGLEYVKTVYLYTDQITSLAFSQNGEYLSIGSLDKNCRILNVQKQFTVFHKIQENQSPIFSVCFSSDSKYFLLCHNESLSVYSVQNKFQNIKRIEAHTLDLCSLALSCDGKYLATSSQDKSCIIWDMKNKFNIIHKITEHTGSVNFITFSPNSKYLATISQDKDKTCKIWNVENKFEIFDKLKGLDFVTFSADGKYLASTSGKTFKIMKFNQGFQIVKKIENEVDNDIYSQINFSSDMKYIVVIKGQQTCQIYDVNQRFQLIKEILKATTYALSPNGKFLATNSFEKACRIFSLEKNFDLIAQTQENSSDISIINFSQDSKYLVTGSSDFTCKIWSVTKDFQLINTAFGHTANIQQAAFSVDSKYLVSLSNDQTFKIWNLTKSFEHINSLKGHANAVTQAIFSPNCKYLVTSSEDSTCRIYDVKRGFEVINTINQHSQKVTSIDFSPNGKYLATVSLDKTCKVFNVKQEFKLVFSIQAHISLISCVKFSLDGKYLATSSWDKSCKIWDVNNEFQLLYTIQGHSLKIMQIAFSKDSKYLATCSLDKTCKIWNAGKEFQIISTIQGHALGVTSVAFSNNNKYLVTGSVDKSFNIWSVQNSFQLIKEIEKHNDPVISISFSIDDKFLATGSEDSTCKIWDVENGFELLYTTEGHNMEILHVGFSPDGKYLTTSSQDNTCKVWIEKNIDQQNNKGDIIALANSADGKYIASCTRSNQWKILEQATDIYLKYSNIKIDQENNLIEFTINSNLNQKYQRAGNGVQGHSKEEKIQLNILQVKNFQDLNQNQISYQQLYEL